MSYLQIFTVPIYKCLFTSYYLLTVGHCQLQIRASWCSSPVVYIEPKPKIKLQFWLINQVAQRIQYKHIALYYVCIGGIGIMKTPLLLHEYAYYIDIVTIKKCFIVHFNSNTSIDYDMRYKKMWKGKTKANWTILFSQTLVQQLH